MTILLPAFAVCVKSQTPVPTAFSFPTGLSHNGNAFEYSMVANELRIHIIRAANGSLVYNLVGFNGRIVLIDEPDRNRHQPLMIATSFMIEGPSPREYVRNENPWLVVVVSSMPTAGP